MKLNSRMPLAFLLQGARHAPGKGGKDRKWDLQHFVIWRKMTAI